MELIGTHCNPLELTGTHWNSLELTGTHWNSLELIGIHWNSFATPTGHRRDTLGARRPNTGHRRDTPGARWPNRGGAGHLSGYRPSNGGIIPLAGPRSFASPARTTRNRNRFPGRGISESSAISPPNLRCVFTYETDFRLICRHVPICLLYTSPSPRD